MVVLMSVWVFISVVTLISYLINTTTKKVKDIIVYSIGIIFWPISLVILILIVIIESLHNYNNRK